MAAPFECSPAAAPKGRPHTDLLRPQHTRPLGARRPPSLPGNRRAPGDTFEEDNVLTVRRERASSSYWVSRGRASCVAAPVDSWRATHSGSGAPKGHLRGASSSALWPCGPPPTGPADPRGGATCAAWTRSCPGGSGRSASLGAAGEEPLWQPICGRHSATFGAPIVCLHFQSARLTSQLGAAASELCALAELPCERLSALRETVCCVRWRLSALGTVCGRLCARARECARDCVRDCVGNCIPQAIGFRASELESV